MARAALVQEPLLLPLSSVMGPWRASGEREAKMRLADALKTHRAQVAAAPDNAKQVIANGESKPKAILPAPEFAAWTMVANLLLNLDETVTRN